MVKKRMNIIFNMVIPTLLAYGVFFLLYSIFQQHFYEYRWLAAIPLKVGEINYYENIQVL